ncbi:hypothetical protein F441_08156 [Phytophthora nicotianae CJ01A1]|uniref:Uncharacterized protein n=2 Tax=Phytophthora nicotianae TaxID=4792 RepID=W2GXJ0_PHYNI|nr:hypothetical protein L915_08005 [Phytophthora nicotianae]ETL41047.1 hypothetical protein L916_07928 [Phytophthora nicotianae]ETP17465.1 hypothetical protein F441_08156 [Phytophthora nicotianae CJ01A1]
MSISTPELKPVEDEAGKCNSRRFQHVRSTKLVPSLDGTSE